MIKLACKKSVFWFLLLLPAIFFNASECSAQKKNEWVHQTDEWVFSWDLEGDKASVKQGSSGSAIWQGSLMPAFWLLTETGNSYVKAVLKPGYTLNQGSSEKIPIVLSNLGEGYLTLQKGSWGVEISELVINWKTKAPAIIEMYFGISAIDNTSSTVMPTWDRPFMPDWRAGNYCIPGAKEGPVQSYFRMWDFGNTNIALGSFATTLGAPYGAAYPRPTLYASMGSEKGFVTIGAGSVPDGALSLCLQSTNSCMKLLYREDLWNASATLSRKWESPIRISADKDAYSSIKKYYSSFTKPLRKTNTIPVKSIWNTWGMWKDRKYPIRPIADLTSKLGAGMLVLDDPWEESQGAGKPSLKRFPDFNGDLAYVRSKNIEVGIWETMGWITDPYSFGLTDKDLILNKSGKPAKGNWAFNPWGEGYYCLDLSSEKTRTFLKERTIGVMKSVKPSLIKLDFGYGLPDPNMGVPADPKYRGERYSFELLKLISEAAKSVNPEVVIMYYSISPLFLPYADMVSLDDQGDLGYDVKGGHQEWSIWASLISEYNTVISGSSSYDWDQDDEVILNSFILGHPGSVLPSHLNEQTVPEKYLNRRYAIHQWYRKTTNWTPLWLNSSTGSIQKPPQINSWGRMENNLLTALSLRENKKTPVTDSRLEKLSFSGRWSLISQDNADIFSSASLACIPFDEGWITIPMTMKPASISRQSIDGSVPFTDWNWNNGLLKIIVSAADLEKTAGFLINQKR